MRREGGGEGRVGGESGRGEWEGGWEGVEKGTHIHTLTKHIHCTCLGRCTAMHHM